MSEPITMTSLQTQGKDNTRFVFDSFPFLFHHITLNLSNFFSSVLFEILISSLFKKNPKRKKFVSVNSWMLTHDRSSNPLDRALDEAVHRRHRP